MSLTDRRMALFAAVFLPGFIIGVACSKPSNFTADPKPASPDELRAKEQVIYGDDDRRDLYAETDSELRMLADSTVALIRREDLSKPTAGTFNVKTKVFGDRFALCADEPFRTQDTAAFCTGFLVAPDTIVTAGHCVTNDRVCGETAFVFGFALHTPNSSVKTVPASEIYNCASIVHTQKPNPGADFAVLKLDRNVTTHAPLKVRMSGAISVDEDLLVIGHPSGLPTKIAGGARVRRVAGDGYFVANLDTYGGNSGSPVFNGRTHEVEGILVRGEVDYVLRQSEKCNVSYRCENSKCRGEDVTAIAETLKFFE